MSFYNIQLLKDRFVHVIIKLFNSGRDLFLILLNYMNFYFIMNFQLLFIMVKVHMNFRFLFLLVIFLQVVMMIFVQVVEIF